MKNGAATGAGSTRQYVWLNPEAQRRCFSDAWLGMLQLQLPDDIYRYESKLYQLHAHNDIRVCIYPSCLRSPRVASVCVCVRVIVSVCILRGFVCTERDFLSELNGMAQMPFSPHLCSGDTNDNDNAGKCSRGCLST